ncbi:MAG: type I-D CRISPR-associated helicase Cas3', partial [Dolichospermum sp.]
DLINRLEIAGFRCKQIDPLAENKYQFPDNIEQETQIENQGWRQIAREITLNFMPLEPSFKAAETWLKSNSNIIISQFQQYPGSKGAILLTSIASVKRLTPFFQQLLQPYNLTVGENTGLSSKGEKELSLAAD